MRCIIKNNSIIRRSILASCFLLLASCFLAIYPTKALGQMIDCADPQEDHPEVPYKCLNLQNNQVYTITICGNEIPQMGCNDCCFTLEYCWRWIPPSQPGYNDDRFDVLFKKITYSGTTSDCWKCARENYDLLVEMLHKKILIAHVAEHNIDGNTKEYNHLVLRSACTRFDGTEYVDCGKEWECCYQTLTLSMTEYPYEVTQYSKLGSDIFYPNNPTLDCSPPPASCSLQCGFIEGLSLQPTCDIECEFSNWIDDEPILIPYYEDNCLGCIITIYYQYRSAINCGRNWLDYRINKIVPNQNCINCNVTEADMFQHAIENVLKGGAHSLPGAGETIYDYRFVLLSCWKYLNQYFPCQTSFCCKSEYSVYNPGEGLPLIITQTYRDAGINNCNDSNDPLCRVICDDYLYRKVDKTILNNNRIKTTIVTPFHNFIDNKFDCQIESNILGNGKIIIYDLMGSTIKEKYFIKNSVNQLFSIDIDNLQNGLYVYYIYLNDVKVYSNKLIINK